MNSIPIVEGQVSREDLPDLAILGTCTRGNTPDFIEWKNDSMNALSVTLPGRFILWVNPSSAMRCLNAPAAYSMSRSVWKIRP